MKILEVENLSKTYTTERFFGSKIRLRALYNLNLSVDFGETLGIIGESGSGKSTLARIICKLLPRDSGNVKIEGVSIDDIDRISLSQKVQMVFQDPYSSLNPKLTVGVHLLEAIKNAKNSFEATLKAKKFLELVGLGSEMLNHFPHQLSGGQRQRVAIARAIAAEPKIIIADEPVSALDISVQSQILNLFKELKDNLAVSFIFISHDIFATAYLSDRIVVMKDGEIVEEGETEKLLKEPKSEYTKKLINSFIIAEAR